MQLNDFTFNRIRKFSERYNRNQITGAQIFNEAGAESNNFNLQSTIPSTFFN